MLVLVAGLGVGGKFAWYATAVRRDCPFQAADVQGIVPWPVDTARVTYGPKEQPFIRCEYQPAFDQSRAGKSANYRSVTYRTRDDSTPNDWSLSGGYWGGPGYACMTGRQPQPSALPNETDATVSSANGSRETTCTT